MMKSHLKGPFQEINHVVIQAAAATSSKYREIDRNDDVNFGTPTATITAYMSTIASGRSASFKATTLIATPTSTVTLISTITAAM